MAPRDKDLPAETAGDIRKDFQSLLDAATHSGTKVRTWQSFLQEMEAKVHGSRYWDCRGSEPDKVMEWIYAVWIMFGHPRKLLRNFREVNAVVVLQYVWEVRQGWFLRDCRDDNRHPNELTADERADRCYKALRDTSVS